MMKPDNYFKDFEQNDIYSLILFALFNITEIPEYSTLSELIYILDKDAFLKLCEYFGGLTITIPTIEQLEILIKALMIYQKVDLDKEDFNKVVANLDTQSYKLKQVKDTYIKLSKIMEKYKFEHRKNIGYNVD